jgi:glutaredoxin
MDPEFPLPNGHRLEVFSTRWCPDCTRLKRWLAQRAVPYEEIDIDEDPGAAERLERETGKRAIPFILVDGRNWVRGYHREHHLRLDGELLVRELALAMQG